MTEATDDPIEALYANATMWAEGTTYEYRGYELRKVESVGLSPAHSEWGLYNPAEKKVESFTVDVFDDCEAFREKVDRVIDYDPDSLRDWLNRDQGGVEA